MSPQSVIQMKKDKSYNELIDERNKVIEEIKDFENTPYDPENYNICPSPDVFYQWNLEYLGLLCNLIAEKFREDPEEEQTQGD